MIQIDFETLAKQTREFRANHKVLTEKEYSLPYNKWYDFRICLSHQKATRADEVWFARQIGASISGTGKKYYEKLRREVDLGDGYVGDTLIPAKNNYDLKVTYQETDKITEIGFQQYRPADPIGFYVAFKGISKNKNTIIVVPNEVAYKMKREKIEKTGRLGSAQGTGYYKDLTTEALLSAFEGAKDGSKGMVISFSVKEKSDKDNFELLMDEHQVKIDDVADYINNYKHKA